MMPRNKVLSGMSDSGGSSAHSGRAFRILKVFKNKAFQFEGWLSGRVTHGAPAAPAPRLGSLGSPCTCTMVHLGSSAPNCTVHLGASELMRTRIKVLIRPLAPNRTVHLGASERLTVCVAQPGNGYTSARIAAKTFRLQLSYTKIKSG